MVTLRMWIGSCQVFIVPGAALAGLAVRTSKQDLLLTHTLVDAKGRRLRSSE